MVTILNSRDQVSDVVGVEKVTVVRDNSIACQFFSSLVLHNTRVPQEVDPADFFLIFGCL